MDLEPLIGSAPRRSHRRGYGLVGAAAAVAVVAECLSYWTFHPRELSKYRPLQSGLHTLTKLGKTEYLTQFVGPDNTLLHDTTVDLRRVTHVIVENSAHARVQVLTCVPSSPSEGASGSLSDFCRSAQLFRPGVINLAATRHLLVLAITPTRAGHVDIAGLRVQYRDGIRRGSQRTGNEISMITA